GVVERSLLAADHRTAQRVHLGGEVPAADVGRAVIAVADDAVAQCADLLGVGPDLGPGGRRVVRVQARPLEQLLVVEQAEGVVRHRYAVQVAAGAAALPVDVDQVGLEAAQALDLAGVLADVGGLAGVDDVGGVGEVRVEDVVHLAAGQLGVERRRVVAGVGVVALDGDAGVGLLEQRDVLHEELALGGLGLGRFTAHGDGHVAARAARAARAGSAAARAARGHGDRADNREPGHGGMPLAANFFHGHLLR